MAVLTSRSDVPEELGPGKAWGDFVQENRPRFERTMGVPVGKLLGCGYFGCVFESSPPWVVKFTRDDTEGDVWSVMAELLADPEVTDELGAFLRVRDVARILPDVVFDDEEMPVFGIVREEALPVLYSPHIATEETLRRLGITTAMLESANISPESPSMRQIAESLGAFPARERRATEELLVVLAALQHYRKHALVFSEWRGRLTHRDYGGLGREEAEDIADEAFRQMLGTIDVMRGEGYVNRFGDVIGQTLAASVNFGDLVFRDLHLFNVGWRMHTDIDRDSRPDSMVILDPGAMATPYSPEVREVELAANKARASLRSRP